MVNEKISFPKTKENPVLFQVDYWYKNSMDIYTRRYKKIQDVLANIGGFLKTILEIGIIFNHFNHKYQLITHTAEILENNNLIVKTTLENNSYLRSSTDNEFLSYSYLLRVFPFLNGRIPWETLQDCNKAIKLDPKSATAYIVKGIVQNTYGETSNYVRALENFEKAFELNPTPKLYEKMISAYTQMQGPQEHEYDEKIFETASKGLDLIKQWRTKYKLEELPWGEDIQNYRLWKLETYFRMDRERYFKNKKDTISEKKEDEKIKYLLFEHKYGKMNVMFDILGLGYDF